MYILYINRIDKVKASYNEIAGSFLYTTSKNYPKLTELCGENKPNLPTILAIKNRKNQIRGVYLENEFNEANISNFVDRVTGGDIQFSKCSSDLSF